MRTYAIVPINEVTQEMLDHCIQTSFDTLRRNLAGTQCVLKWEGDKPECLQSYQDYTNEEILIIISDIENGWEPEFI